MARICWCVGAWLVMASITLADVPGDADGDGDVDFDDFELLTICTFGPDSQALSLCHEIFDFDFDTDVDMADFAAFQRCFSGDKQPGVPGCVPHRARIENGCLHVIGTAADSVLALRLRPGAPSILDIDVGNDGTPEFSFDRALFACILVDARGGDDIILIDELNGVFTDTELTTLSGGSGNDTLVGGSGGETFLGGDGNDTILMGGGNDRFIWSPGHDTDLVEGGDGIDTVEVNGSNNAEVFTVTANGLRVRFDRLSPTPFFLDIGTCESLILNANGGNDMLSCTGNLAALIQITADGGPGNDTLLGSNGADFLLGGDDNDFIDGQQGNDLVFLGAGDDTFQWDPGDGSDIVEGQAGHDTIVFNGSAAAETFDFAANGPRLRFTRNVGTIVMDLDGIEQFDLRALGGADLVTVNDLGATAVTQVNIDLAGTIGGTIGDTQADDVFIVGTPAADVFNVTAESGFVVVDRVADVRVRGFEPTDQVVFAGVGGDVVNVHGSPGPDTITVVANGPQARVDATGYSAAVAVSGALSLTIQAQGGDDLVSCTGNLAALVPITIDGGPGNDTLLGSNGADLLLGGDDNDFIDGQQGNDIVFLGPGDDTFRWDPGDGSDTVEGQAGHDTIVFNGSGAAETFDFAANGPRLRFTRNVGTIVMDLDGIEQFDLQALGGADLVTVNDLGATAVTQVNIDLAATIGGTIGDAQADAITVNGTDDPDTIHAEVISGAVEVSGLAALVRIRRSEAANDTLTINGLGGADVITADPGVQALIMLIINP